MSHAEIKQTILDYKVAAQHAKDAGFDGIEIHAQAGMLIPQFLSLEDNHCNDEYGGSIENRARIIFEIWDAITEVWDSTRIAIRFTPVMLCHVGIVKPDIGTIPLFKYLLNKLSNYNLAYLHIVGPSEDLSGTSVETLQDDYFGHFRANCKGNLMANLGFNKNIGSAILQQGKADFVSFGEPFIANPDLVDRFRHDLPLAKADRNTFYGGDENGYTNYPRAVYP